MNVFKVTLEGTTVEMEDRPMTLVELQDAVGGYIETVRLDATTLMVVDEEGFLKGKPVNSIASMMAKRRIVGEVVIIPESYLD